MNTEENNFDRCADMYRTIAERYTFNRPTYTQLGFHVWLGQVFRDIAITGNNDTLQSGVPKDGRIHLLHFDTQETGKNRLLTLIQKISEETNRYLAGHTEPPFNEFWFQRIEDFTDAGLIGSKAEDGINQQYGVLDRRITNIAAAQEAKSFFNGKGNTNKVNAQNYLLTTMNSHWGRDNIITKRMAGNFRVVCKADTSLLFTSTPTKDIRADNLGEGLFRRFAVDWNYTSPEQKITEIKEMERAKKENSGINEPNIINELVRAAVGRRLELLKSRSAEDAPLLEVRISEEANDSITQKLDKMQQDFKGYKIYSSEMIDSLSAFSIAYTHNHVPIIAAHRAVLDRRDTITAEDIDYAYSIMEPVIRKVGQFIAYTYNKDWTAKPELEEQYARIEVYKLLKKKGGELSSSVIIKYFDKLGMTRQAAHKQIRKLAEAGVVDYDPDNEVVKLKYTIA